ncbi:(4Fe-4S)-binding protein [Arcanobacterium pinnipediorum]|uniref:(4Fe-4S)-binding protein n=1 Tax=Arcanobacterium pinnipediorum TaxID=1503041 RepID=A0ABY5AKV1_9ACTO|nr:(4Fe-4S)-binding protein [Arcanobacterium pinnipediorum]USR79838.1 (4Fe-4S)-binding protein [Arcanobacterium pinnipediorum]
MTRKLYNGTLTDVSFDREICEHAGECVRGMPSVFNVNARPWINQSGVTTAQDAHHLADVIARCPSGALILERLEVA